VLAIGSLRPGFPYRPRREDFFTLPLLPACGKLPKHPDLARKETVSFRRPPEALLAAFKKNGAGAKNNTYAFPRGAFGTPRLLPFFSPREVVMKINGPGRGT